MKRAVCLLALCGTFVAPLARARAEEGWKMPNLNPFKSTEPTSPSSARKPISSSQPPAGGKSWLSLPSWAGAAPAKSASRRPEPSTWEKMNAGAKNTWTKTKQTLNPWASQEPDNAVRRPPTGMNQQQPWNAARKPPEKKKGLFGSWFEPTPEPAQPRTVLDFLDQPRPEF